MISQQLNMGPAFAIGASYSNSALSDPTGAAPIVDAARWIQHALLGSTATMIAALAIAAIGFLALSGRVELRRGVTVVMGSFILFGAPSIAAAFVQAFEGSASVEQTVTNVAPASMPVAAQPPPPPPSLYDPYAGASVERR